MSKIKLPSWPRERDLNRYSEFTGINLKTALNDNKVWIDIGCRTGIALSQSRQFYRAKLIGVNAHKIRVLPGIKSFLSKIPQSLDIHKKFKGKATLVTDIHGAVSYSTDPLATLIYEATLLEEKGKAIIVTIESRIGNAAAWKRIVQFFKLHMYQKISYKRFPSYSDNSKTLIKTIRIVIKGKNKSKLSLTDLFELSEKLIGKKKKFKVIAESLDKTVQIWSVLYSIPR